MKQLWIGLIIASMAAITTSYAGEITVDIYTTDAKKPKLLGSILFQDIPYGLLISPKLKGLPPGLHGFHLHEFADCGDGGTSAGGHYDPKRTKSHQGPYGQGHLGDLPALSVTQDTESNTPILAPRLSTENLKGVSVMIHAGGDNYSDRPKLGGGGTRIACGVIPSEHQTDLEE